MDWKDKMEKGKKMLMDLQTFKDSPEEEQKKQLNDWQEFTDFMVKDVT